MTETLEEPEEVVVAQIEESRRRRLRRLGATGPHFPLRRSTSLAVSTNRRSSVERCARLGK